LGLNTESLDADDASRDFCFFMMKELLLIRHGESLHAGTRYIGRTDTPLTPVGHEQAEAVSRRLAETALDALFVSPALRARETIQPLLSEQKIKPVIDADLQEIDFGTWEGLSFAEIQAQSPERVNAWASNRMDFCFPGGESLDSFWKRVCRAGERLASTPGERIAVVTHGGVIRYLLCYYLGLSPERHRLFQIDLGSITTLVLNEGSATLKGLNA
jgi:alpha-ribazole phosphatase